MFSFNYTIFLAQENVRREDWTTVFGKFRSQGAEKVVSHSKNTSFVMVKFKKLSFVVLNF